MYDDKEIKFQLRGDDIEIINAIKNYVPLFEREDIRSWLCYLENTIKESV